MASAGEYMKKSFPGKGQNEKIFPRVPVVVFKLGKLGGRKMGEDGMIP